MTTTTSKKQAAKLGGESGLQIKEATPEKPKPSTYGLTHKKLLTVHRECVYGWKWVSAEEIAEHYPITPARLDQFHSLYGLPRMVTTDKKPSIFSAIYSLPALEYILHTVPELND